MKKKVKIVNWKINKKLLSYLNTVAVKTLISFDAPAQQEDMPATEDKDTEEPV
ncbi:MAG: hypothetical protein LIP11_06545 [Clostridiales bacterium]|nr:hypothetical protein [Clostridiales bacterium]